MTYMLHHSVLQVFPPLLSLLWVREDVCGRAVSWALSQLLPIILHQGGPAHQLHSGELLQKVPRDGRGWWSKLHFFCTLQQSICTQCQYTWKLLWLFPLELQKHNNLCPQKHRFQQTEHRFTQNLGKGCPATYTGVRKSIYSSHFDIWRHGHPSSTSLPIHGS